MTDNGVTQASTPGYGRDRGEYRHTELASRWVHNYVFVLLRLARRARFLPSPSPHARAAAPTLHAGEMNDMHTRKRSITPSPPPHGPPTPRFTSSPIADVWIAYKKNFDKAQPSRASVRPQPKRGRAYVHVQCHDADRNKITLDIHTITRTREREEGEWVEGLTEVRGATTGEEFREVFYIQRSEGKSKTPSPTHTHTSSHGLASPLAGSMEGMQIRATHRQGLGCRRCHGYPHPTAVTLGPLLSQSVTLQIDLLRWLLVSLSR